MVTSSVVLNRVDERVGVVKLKQVQKLLLMMLMHPDACERAVSPAWRGVHRCACVLPCPSQDLGVFLASS